MSLLFDALKRAQGNEDKPLQLQDASSPDTKPLPDASQRSGGNEAGKVAMNATDKPKSTALPYAVAGLVLLAGGAAWFFYQKNQYIPITPLNPVPVTEVAMVNQPSAASMPVAASNVAETSAASGVASSVNKSWTHPATPHRHKKHGKKPALHGMLASNDQDPLKEGYLALSYGRLDQAEKHYLAALAQHPHEKDALLGLAVIAQRRMQMDRAASLYRQVLHEDMGNAAAAAGLVSLSMQADPVAAESQLRELLDIKPAAHEFHYALGGVLARQLRWGEAQQSFFRAYNLQPGNALYAYNLAVSLDRLHQPAAALPYYETAARHAKPGDPSLNMDVIGRRIQELSPVAPAASR